MQNILEEHCFPHTIWFSEIVLPEFAEDDFPDIPEMEEIRRKIDLFMDDWQTVESKIKQSSLVQLVVFEVAEQTPESLLKQTVLVMESKWCCLCAAHLTSWEGLWSLWDGYTGAQRSQPVLCSSHEAGTGHAVFCGRAGKHPSSL